MPVEWQAKVLLHAWFCDVVIVCILTENSPLHLKQPLNPMHMYFKEALPLIPAVLPQLATEESS